MIATKFVNLKPYYAGNYADNSVDKLQNTIRLSLNESPYGMCAQAKAAILDEDKNVYKYPDSNLTDLCNTISKTYNVNHDMVFAGNGVDELLLIIALAFISPNAKAVTTKSTFFGFQAAIEVARAKCEVTELDNYKVSVPLLINRLDKDVSLIYICNPHNPTGTLISEADIKSIISEAEKIGSIVIFDEAYAEYTDSECFSSCLKYVNDKSHVIVLRTFSKLYGLAGLRCGYAIASPSIIRSMRCVRNVLPFNVNRLAQKAAIASLECTEFKENIREKNKQVKIWFYKELGRLKLDYIESQTNFILIKLPISSKDFCKILFEQFKILVRNADEFGFLNHIRVSLGTLEDMAYVVKCFEKTLHQLKT